MRKRKMLESMELLDEKYVEEASPRNASFMDILRKKLDLRRVYLAACLCIACVLTVSVFIPFIKEIAVPVRKGAAYSATHIGNMLYGAYDGVPTSSYTEVIVPSSDYLNLQGIPDEKYLTLYEQKEVSKHLDEGELLLFADATTRRFAKAVGESAPSYKSQKLDFDSDNDDISIHSEDIGKYSAFARQTAIHNRIDFDISYNEKEDFSMQLGDVKVEIDQRDTDEEIIASLEEVKKKIFYICGASFSNARVVRRYNEYNEHGATRIYIYYYNEYDHPLNKLTDDVYSDYIIIAFDNDHRKEQLSEGVLKNVGFSYYRYRVDSKKLYKPVAKAEMISLENAEELLYKGYVFGGHICSLCMQAQQKVDFENYDFVELTYVLAESYKEKITEAIPFYAFYKYIGVAKNGNAIYAKTYVPAVEVDGYEEYFESQTSQHDVFKIVY